MRLKEEMTAPDFVVTDIQGNKVTLSNFENKVVLLAFFRYASCPLCNLRISQLIQNYDSLHSKGLQVLAFFQSPKEHMLEYVGKQTPPFPLIPDPKREIYRLYKVEKSWLKYVLGGISLKMFQALRSGFKLGKADGQRNLVPADFIVMNQVIKRAYYGKSIADHLPLPEIVQFLEEESQVR